METKPRRRSTDMKLSNLLKTENLIGAMLLAFLTWLGTTAVSSNEAVASLQSQQLENERVNQLVYDMHDVLPRIDSTLVTVSTTLEGHTTMITDVKDTQQEIKARLYCASTFPIHGIDEEGNSLKQADCIDQLTDGKA